jgi:glycosyltransferase involved in cell wall biosynthesis
LLEQLRDRLGDLRVFVSIPMEPNRPWPVEWGTLDVVVQRSLMVKTRWHHPAGFSENSYLHVPYDTIFKLWRYRPDVIISGELGPRTCLGALYRIINPRVRLIIWATLSEHTEQGRGRWRRLMRRCVLPRADMIFVNGRSGQRYVEGLGVPAEKIFTVFPYTADERSFVPLAAQASKTHQTRRLLYVGQLIERKGLVPFFLVLSEWARSNPGRRIEFWVCGEGPLRLHLEQLAVPANVSVRFLGPAAHDSVTSIYSEADILVLPTLADEWGLVVNEALAAGVPILGSLYSQAVEELVKDRENGWTFFPDRPSEMYAALSAALETTPEEHVRMRHAARMQALELTPSRIADRLVEAVNCVARKSC